MGGLLTFVTARRSLGMLWSYLLTDEFLVDYLCELYFLKTRANHVVLTNFLQDYKELL